MSNIEIRTLTGIPDPVLRPIAERVRTVMLLAGEKAMAHVMDPVDYPMPPGRNSLEELFLARFQSLSQEKRERSLGRFKSGMRVLEDARNRAQADLAKIELHSQQPVAEQAFKIGLPASLKISPTDWSRFAGRQPSHVMSGPTPALSDRLWLRIRRVECLDETDGFGGFEAGKDEMYMAGTGVDAGGNALPLGPLHLGDFDEDDSPVKDFPSPWRIMEFDLTQVVGDVIWPRHYLATMILIEHDNGDLSELEQKIFDKAKEQAQKYVKEGVAAGTAELGPILSWLASEIAAWIVGEIFEWFRSAWEDELFPPISLEATIPFPGCRFNHKNHSDPLYLTWKGYGGEYQVTCDFRVAWANEIQSLRNTIGIRFDLSNGLRPVVPVPDSGSVRELIESYED